MSSTASQYAVALKGDNFDLADLRRIFAASGDVMVTELQLPDGKVTALLSNEFTGMASGPEVVEAAERILGELNGILFAADPDRSPGAMGPVYERKPDGTWSRGTIYASGVLQAAPARMRAEAFLTDKDGNPVASIPVTPRQLRWFYLASAATPDGQRALDIIQALRGNPDWYDLRSAFELFMADEKKLSGWQSDDIEWFRKTATLHRHTRTTDHGKKALLWFTGNGKPRMDLRSARRVVAKHAALWLDRKSP